MKVIGIAAAVIAAALGALVIFIAFSDESGAPEAESIAATPTQAGEPTPTPLPSNWLEAIDGDEAGASPVLVSCFDGNNDGRLNAADGETLIGVDIPLIPGQACLDPTAHADYFASRPLPVNACEASEPPLLIVAVASAGSDLLDPSEGESLGLIDIIDQLQPRLRELGIEPSLVVSVAAIFGAEQPQTNMERWLTVVVRRALQRTPCLRAVLIGHSHGGATVTSVTSALDGEYASRLLGVIIDRTVALYDRPATEMPSQTRILNFFQVNEGWHGERIDLPNVVNFDESNERAPVAPSDGGGGFALVSHKTLDDAPGVQRRVVDSIVSWATGAAP